MPEQKEEEIRSEEIQDVLNAVPNWMIRYGITVIFGIIVIGVFLSWLIKYPQTLTGEGKITTQLAPINLVSQVNGRILHIYKKDGDPIKKGDPIAEIESSTKLENVHFIQTFLTELSSEKVYESISLDRIDTNLVFGDAQAGVNALVKSLYEYQHYVEDKEQEIKAKFLKDKIRLQKDLVVLQQDQVRMLSSELKNKDEKWKAWQKLYADSSIAKFEMLQVENEYLQKKREYQSLEKQLVQNKYSLVDLNQQYADIEINNVKLYRTLIENIDAQKRTLSNMIEKWQKSFVITAPENGKIAYTKNVNENDYINMGEELFAVFSDNDSLYAFAKVPMIGAGKLREGQDVRIALNAFPREEFGIIQGKVTSVSPLTSQSGYYVRVALTDQLTTSYKKDIPFRPELSGNIEIIVDKRRLIYRVFDSIYKLFDDLEG